MKNIVIIFVALLCLSACQTRHEKLQKEIEMRRSALKHHQDSALTASEKEIEQVYGQLEQARSQYQRMLHEAEAAHAAGTATAAQLTRVTQMRMHRDSLQVQFDVLCAKVKYIKKRQMQK